MKGKQKKCILCREILILGYGNNPDPVAKEGECCDKCNMTKVIPARLEELKEYDRKNMANLN